MNFYEAKTNLDFGEALKALKEGRAVTRKGWNGKGQFAFYVPADRYPAKTLIAKAMAAEDGKVDYRAYFALRTAQGDVATWVPSVSDCLAEDWIILTTIVDGFVVDDSDVKPHREADE